MSAGFSSQKKMALENKKQLVSVLNLDDAMKKFSRSIANVQILKMLFLLLQETTVCPRLLCRKNRPISRSIDDLFAIIKRV
jgi:hypothetical protein